MTLSELSSAINFLIPSVEDAKDLGKFFEELQIISNGIPKRKNELYIFYGSGQSGRHHLCTLIEKSFPGQVRRVDLSQKIIHMPSIYDYTQSRLLIIENNRINSSSIPIIKELLSTDVYPEKYDLQGNKLHSTCNIIYVTSELPIHDKGFMRRTKVITFTSDVITRIHPNESRAINNLTNKLLPDLAVIVRLICRQMPYPIPLSPIITRCAYILTRGDRNGEKCNRLNCGIHTDN